MSEPPQAHARALTSILFDAGVVTDEQVRAGLELQRENGLRIGETLVEMGAATEEDIGWALARQLGLSFVDPQPEALDRELIRSFPDGLLRRLDVVPLVRDAAVLSIAVADPTDPGVIGELERVSACALRLSVATPSAIRRVLAEVLGTSVLVRAGREGRVAPDSGEFHRRRAESTTLTEHLNRAIAGGARELHFIPRRGGVSVFHRRGGRLVDAGAEGEERFALLLARLETLGAPPLAAGAGHAAGIVDCPAGTDTLRLAVSLLRQAAGVAVTLGILPAAGSAVGFDALGIAAVDVARIRAALDPPYGLCVVAGPPRCGGSTTLASLLLDLGAHDRRVLVFGAPPPWLPVEWVAGVLPDAAAGEWLAVAAAQSADVVALDGVLPGGSTEAVLGSAGAGRLVLLRTDWMDTFAMLESLDGRPWARAALADRLRCVIQQRRIEAGKAPAGDAIPGDRFLFEPLIVDEPLRQAIRAGGSTPALRAAAVAGGFVPLAKRVRELVEAGALSPAEAARALS